jgi:hypothetical protein
MPPNDPADKAKPPAPAAREAARERQVKVCTFGQNSLIAKGKEAEGGLSAAEHQAIQGYVDKIAKLEGLYAPTEVDHTFTPGEVTPRKAGELVSEIFGPAVKTPALPEPIERPILDVE